MHFQRYILSVALVLGSAFYSAGSFAEPFHSDLLTLQLKTWQAAASFHQLAVASNDPRDLERLEATLNAGDEALANIEERVELGQYNNVQYVIHQWNALKRRARNNPFTVTGKSDYLAVTEINNLVLSINDQMTTLTRYSRKRPQDSYLEAAIILQRIASDYLGVTSDPEVSISLGTTAESVRYGEEASRFENLMQQFNGATADPQEQKQIAHIGRRWDFIKGSIWEMENRDVVKVPLLIYYYANRITEELMELAPQGGSENS